MSNAPHTGPVIVGIGSSAGGAAAVSQLLHRLPDDFRAPVLISQHMPDGTSEATRQLVGRRLTRPVELADDGMRLRPGSIFLAPSGCDLRIDDTETMIRLRLEAAPSNGPHPSVDTLFTDMARVFGPGCCVAVLSGMGSDGLEGAREIKSRGGLVYVQDRGSSAVWGMPARIVEQGLADLEGSVEQIAACIGRNARMRGAIGA